MRDYTAGPVLPISEAQLSETFAAAMRRVYLWMFLGLSLTAAISTFVAGNEAALNFIFGSPVVFFGLIIGELALVIAISAAINRLSPAVASALFFFYAAVNGATMAGIFLAYDLGDIALAFVSAAGLFAAMSFIGYTTKEDLSGWGKWLMMGLVGIIIASVVNIFLANSTLDWILSYLGVGLFLALTIYDTQKIKGMTYGAVSGGDTQVVGRVGVLGALRLYLDFINLFLFLLRIFGRRR